VTTTPGDERAREGPGDFRDVLDVQVMDESLLAVARISRAPAEGSATVAAVVLAGGDRVAEVTETVEAGVDSWESATAGPLRLGVEEPLARWTLALDAPGARVTLELRAVTGPADLAEPATAAIGRTAGLHRYVQLCEARGTVEVDGRSRDVEALAIRSHRWGPVGEGCRARFVTAASEDRTLLTVAAVRPPGTEAHGEELVGGQTLRAGDDQDPEPLPFETVRLSTVFDQDGLPVKASAELFRPGTELPSRLAGVAVTGIPRAVTGGGSLTLFRFVLDGVPALGSYEIEAGG
jgi:hypothetical protein